MGKSGVYHKTSNKQLGGHAITCWAGALRTVRIIGSLPTPGMRSGVIMAHSKSSVETTSAELKVRSPQAVLEEVLLKCKSLIGTGVAVVGSHTAPHLWIRYTVLTRS